MHSPSLVQVAVGWCSKIVNFNFFKFFIVLVKLIVSSLTIRFDDHKDQLDDNDGTHAYA